MFGAHLHLMLNHIPVLGFIFAFALHVAGLARRSAELERAALVAYVVIAALTLPVFFTGDAAADAMSGLEGVNVAAIGPHDEAAGIALTAALATGGLSILAMLLARWKPRATRLMRVVVVVAATVVIVLMANTARLGGYIRHPQESGASGPVENERVIPPAP